MPESLQDRVKRHEGFRATPYRDSVGKLTIGYGRNLSDVGISEDEAAYLLQNDLRKAQDALHAHLPWMQTLSPLRFECFTEMALNMGIEGLLTFHEALAAAQAGNWPLCVQNLQNSQWAAQVHGRATELESLLLAG